MAIKNLYLDPQTNDLVVDENTYNLRVTEGDEYLSQKIQNTLQFFFAEWFLDRSLGIPYFEDILKKNPDLKLVKNLLLNAVAGVSGVDKVLSFETDFDRGAREYTVDFEVLSSSGEVVEGQIVVP
jgi:hypothetical protein